MSDRTRELRSRLVAYLEGRDAIYSAEWRAAFQTVPRHVFVPAFTRKLGHPETEELDSSRPEQYERWLEVAYSDEGLFIPTEEGGLSSSSMPSVMAYMLESLKVESGHRVLEIGTGSGYQAGLLSERLGSEHVTSIDVDPVVVDQARMQLAIAGYKPQIAKADGVLGYARNAPYDRVIGACYAWPVPESWIRQTRPNGRLCVIAPSSLARLLVHEDGSASGPLHWQTFGFMPMRGYNPEGPAAGEWDATVRRGDGETRRCRYSARIVEAGGMQRGFWVLIGMLVLPYEHMQPVSDGLMGWLDIRDGSWLRLDQGRDLVTQGGPRRLWDEVEALYEEWCRLGAPNRERFGLTIQPDGGHVLWLDHADSGPRWEVAVATPRRPPSPARPNQH